MKQIVYLICSNCLVLLVKKCSLITHQNIIIMAKQQRRTKAQIKLEKAQAELDNLNKELEEMEQAIKVKKKEADLLKQMVSLYAGK